MMNIVKSGSQYTIYGESILTYKQLPPDTYKVNFSPLSGFYLTSHHDLAVTEKVYGPYKQKAEKVLKTFQMSNRNMGVILSGPKGAGKSLFARLLAEKGRFKGLPLIIVDQAFPNINNFIASIEQKCIVLFDEFDKIFKIERDRHEVTNNPQNTLLSLLDGIDNGNKLYVITCNDTKELSPCFLNRPGRFHYHFILSEPTVDEVRAYLNDNLRGRARKHIDEIVTLSGSMSFTYDVLRAITFELNQGYNLSETLADLNIEKEPYIKLYVVLKFTNGLISRSPVALEINLTEVDDSLFTAWTYFDRRQIPPAYQTYCYRIGTGFLIKDIVFDKTGLHLKPEAFAQLWWDNLYGEEDPPGLPPDVKAYRDTFVLESVSFEKEKVKVINLKS